MTSFRAPRVHTKVRVDLAEARLPPEIWQAVKKRLFEELKEKPVDISLPVGRSVVPGQKTLLRCQDVHGRVYRFLFFWIWDQEARQKEGAESVLIYHVQILERP